MPILRRSLPLALTIAVHLLIAALFLAPRPPIPGTSAPAAPSAASPITMLVLVRRAAPPAVRVRAAPPKAPSVARARPPARSSPTAPMTPPPPALAVEEPAAAPYVGSLVDRARRDVGKIDLELRGGKPVAVGLAADSPRARFETLMASAFIDRSNTMTIDRYESGDGVIIERVTRRGKSLCYMSGTVNFRPGILSDSSVPKTVSCPRGPGWTRQ